MMAISSSEKECDKMKGNEKMENLRQPEKFVTNCYDGKKYKLVSTPEGDKYILDSGEVKNENEEKSRK